MHFEINAFTFHQISSYPETWRRTNRFKNHMIACTSNTSLDCIRYFSLKVLCMIDLTGLPEHHHSKCLIDKVKYQSWSRVLIAPLIAITFADFQRYTAFAKNRLGRREEQTSFLDYSWLSEYAIFFRIKINVGKKFRDGFKTIDHSSRNTVLSLKEFLKWQTASSNPHKIFVA